MTDVDPLLADFASKSPGAFASTLSRGQADDIAAILQKLPPSLAAAITSRLPQARIDAIVDSGDAALADWLAESTLDDAVRLLGRLPRDRGLALVNSLQSRKRRHKLLQYLHYPPHTVGALVSDVLIRFGADTQARDVLREFRSFETDYSRPIVILHVDGRYLGLLDLAKLLARDPPKGRIREYTLSAPALRPEWTLSSAVQDPGWHSHNWLPVIDHEERLLGGVSRLEMFSAAERQSGNARRDNDLFTSLMTDMMVVLGDLVERILTRRQAS